MRSISYHIAVLALATTLGISGCSQNNPPLSAEARQAMMESDLALLYPSAGEEKQEIALSLEDALMRGIAANLDRKVSEMEKLVAQKAFDFSEYQMLPDMSVSAQYTHRSNSGAASSRSVLSGQESLEPSISTEPSRTLGDAQASLNLMNSWIAYQDSKSRADESYIADERRRKVLQDVAQDTYVAYWRALVAHKTLGEINTLLVRIDAQLDKNAQIDEKGLFAKSVFLDKQKNLLEQKSQLEEMKTQLAFADTELKSLLSLPHGVRITFPQQYQRMLGNITPLKKTGLPLAKLEQIALLNRPEIREEIYNKRIATNNVRNVILETIPGVNILTSFNRDNNKFLADANWLNFSLSLTQNLNNILSFNTRHDLAKSKEALQDVRRMALTAAIIAQTHVARKRVDLSRARFDTLWKSYTNESVRAKIAHDKSTQDAVSADDMLNADIGQLMAKTQAYMGYIEVHNAHARLVNTLGIDALGTFPADMGALSTTLNKVYFNLDDNALLAHLPKKQAALSSPSTAQTEGTP